MCALSGFILFILTPSLICCAQNVRLHGSVNFNWNEKEQRTFIVILARSVCVCVLCVVYVEKCSSVAAFNL